MNNEVFKLKKLKAGFGRAKIEITDKDLPIREFQAKLTDLNSRVAVFGTDEQPDFALAVIEMTSITDRDIQIFKDKITDILNLNSDQIWIGVSHTFSTPHLKNQLNTNADKQSYNSCLEKILSSLGQAVEQAQKDYQVVKVTYQTGACPLNVNRNIETDKSYWLGSNYNAYSNHEIRVVKFTNHAGHSNLIFNYDLQPSVMDHIKNDAGKRLITGDVFGVACYQLEKANDNVVIPLIGAAADQSPIFKGTNHYFYLQNTTFLFTEGEMLAQSIKQTKEKEQLLKADMLYFNFSVLLPKQKRQKKTFDIVPTDNYTFISEKGKVEVHLYALKIGNILFLGTEPELNSKFGKKIRDELDCKQVLLATLVNGGKKYLPEEDDFEHITYQAMNTSIGQRADQTMLKSIEEVNQYLWRMNKC